MKNQNKIKKRSPWIYWIVFAFLAIDAAMLIGLYSWGFFTSVKTTSGFLKNMLFPTLPWEWDLTNYKTAFTLFKKAIIYNGMVYYIGIEGMFYNTITYCLISTTTSTFCQWMMAYLIGRFKCRTTDFIYKVMIVLMMIPDFLNSSDLVTSTPLDPFSVRISFATRKYLLLAFEPSHPSALTSSLYVSP